jgi:hypothetical protein
METIKSELVRLRRPEELKGLLSSNGPCISLYFPVSRENLNPGEDERRWKQVIRRLEPELSRFGKDTRELLDPLRSWDAVSEDRNGKGKTLVVFRSPDFFYRMWVRAEIGERIKAGPQFFIRPLLPLMTDPVFCILALSRNDVRLLRCTLDSSEQVPLTGADTSFERYMNSAKPDHLLANVTSAGPSSGSSKGVTGGTSTEAEDRGEYVAHYFRQIDRALNNVLRETCEPVVLVGVEYELSIYQSISTYPRLSTESVHGAPNGLKGGEMHARAIEALRQHRAAALEQVLAEYNHLVGGGRATNRLKEIVTAAHDGRVVKLIVSDSLEQPGAMDETTYQVTGNSNGGEYDLLNKAAVETILHAGQVFVAPNKKMPNGSPLAAIFRY